MWWVNLDYHELWLGTLGLLAAALFCFFIEIVFDELSFINLGKTNFLFPQYIEDVFFVSFFVCVRKDCKLSNKHCTFSANFIISLCHFLP